jgi:hypothetical protein
MDSTLSPTAVIAARAAVDPDFRAALIREPTATVNAVLAELSLEPLPASVELQVLEETADSAFLVLPPVVAPDPGPERHDAIDPEAVCSEAEQEWRSKDTDQPQYTDTTGVCDTTSHACDTTADMCDTTPVMACDTSAPFCAGGCTYDCPKEEQSSGAGRRREVSLF